jgi:hydrogenase/urease accessory protein HupE
MITRIIQVTFSLLLLSFSLTVNAHTNKLNQAKLQLLEQQKYQLVISIDLLHLIKKQQKFSGDEAELTKYLSRLSLIESKKLLTVLSNNINKQTLFVFEQQKYPTANFSGLTVAELKKRLQPSPLNTRLDLISQGKLPVKVSKLSLELSPLFGDVLLSISHPEKSLINAGNQSHYFSIDKNNTAKRELSRGELKLLNVIEYIYQGFIHILPQGLDHILFVLALFLLATKTSTLLWQISAFTLAHTITLALGIFGVINLPSSIVEPLIALSIAYVAIENIYQQKLTKWRLPIIFAFGLLHGLGFASVLIELGLPKSEYVSSLISFNIGVELGQVTVIALALLATRWCANKPWYRKHIVVPLSIIISLTAIYWLFERIM